MTYQPQQEPIAAPPEAEGRTWVWALACAVAVLLLCIGGGVALALSAKRYGQRADLRALATPTTPARSTAAPTPTATPTPTPPVVPVLALGRTLTVTTEAGDVLKVVVKGKKTRRAACDGYAPKPEKTYYLISDVTVAVAAGRADVAPWDFDLLTPSGSTRPNNGSIRSLCGDDLDYVQDLTAGNKRRGNLVFDVTAAKGHITYKLAGVVVGMWKVG